MAIPKQLMIGVIIGFLIGASLLYAFTQYSSPTKDKQIADLQNQVTSLENYIFFNSQKSAGVPLAGASGVDVADRAVIQNVSVVEGGLLVWAKAIAGQDITITTAWIKDLNETIVTMGRLYSTVLPMDGTSTSITVVLINGALTSGSDYTLNLIGTYGDSLVSPTFTFAEP